MSAGKSKRPRVGIVTNIPAPYRVELFRHAARHFDDLLVLFQDEMNEDRNWERRPELPFRHEYLPRARMGIGRVQLTLNWTIGRHLSSFAPTTIVGFGFSSASILAALYARRHGASFISLNDGTVRTDPLTGVRAMLRKWLLRSATSCIASSSLAADYYYALGMPRHRIERVYLTTDLRRIALETSLPNRRSTVRERLGLTGPTACFVGRLLPDKRVLDGCRAFLSASRKIPNSRMLIVGDGPEREGVQDWIERNAKEQIIMLGSLPWDDMMDIYSAIDALVFPTTRERFGMVVIEALSARVPVIATKTSGAAADLIDNGRNGFKVDEGDTQAMAEAIRIVLSQESVRAAMCEEAGKIVDERDVRIEAQRFASACGAGAADPPKGMIEELAGAGPALG
jgi:glycosyltransferase involved in cell wall biosynthesis